MPVVLMQQNHVVVVILTVTVASMVIRLTEQTWVKNKSNNNVVGTTSCFLRRAVAITIFPTLLNKKRQTIVPFTTEVFAITFGSMKNLTANAR